MLYRIAVGTGFRRGELDSLTPASFDLDAQPPTVTVEAAYSKHRRRDVQPIRRDLADQLRAFLAGRSQHERIWCIPHASALMFRDDLEAAGINTKGVPGRVVDFHSLRHTFVTRLASSNVPVRVATELARHSTVTLTMDRYAHVQLADSVKALEALPPIDERDSTESGAQEPQELEEVSCSRQYLHDSNCLSESSPGTVEIEIIAEGDDRKRSVVARLGMKKPSLSARVVSEADGTRTRNHRIDSPPEDSRNRRDDNELGETVPADVVDQAVPGGHEDVAASQLQSLARAWPSLPDWLRKVILALAGGARTE